MKRQILIALSSIALMIGISTSAHSEENVINEQQNVNIVAQTNDTISVLPTLLESLNIEQIQILNEQEMEKSVAVGPGGNSGQCRPRPHC